MNSHAELFSLDYITQDNPSNPNEKRVRKILEEKHPEVSPIHVETIVPKPAEENFYPVIFSKPTSDLVQKCIHLT